MPLSSHPLLRKRNDDIASVSFSELLFDLIYVFAVTQLSHYLLHHLHWEGLLQMAILWGAVWMAWQHTIWVTNWFDPEIRIVRLMLFGIMLVGLIMTSSIPEAYGVRGLNFVIAYVTIQIGRTIFVLLMLGRKHYLLANFLRILGWFCLSALFWISGALVSSLSVRILLWGIGALIDYMGPITRFYLPFLGHSDSRREWTIEGHHLVERCQLFVIIAFGETILMIGSSLSDIENWNTSIVISAVTSFIGSLAMWWVYFDSSSEAGGHKIRSAKNPGWLGVKYNAVHLVLVGAIIVCSVGDELVVADPSGHIPFEAAFVLIAGPVIYFAANMLYQWITSHTIPLSHVVAILLLLVLILLIGRINLLTMNILITSVILLAVIIETVEYQFVRKER